MPLTVCFFGKIQIGFTFLVPSHLGSPRQRAVELSVCVFVCARVCVCVLSVTRFMLVSCVSAEGSCEFPYFPFI